MAFYPKGIAYTRTFKMIATSDHLSPKTGASPNVNIAKAGASFARVGGTVSEIANGWYKVVLNTTDTNTAGDLSYYINAVAADDTDFADQILDLATAVLGVNIVNWNMTQVATPATAGIPDVNVKNYNNQTATTDANNFPNVNVRDWNAQVVTSLPSGFLTTAFPSGTVASTTNITAATGVTLGAVAPVNVTQWNGQPATYDANNLPNMNTQDWLGARATSVLLQGVPRVDLETWLSTQPLALSSQQVQAVVPASTVVASVTGAVGSVTGNVGGNVTGTVGSVVGAVGSVTGNVGGNVTGSVGSVATGVFINTAIKKNQALANFEFLITDSTNHQPATGAAALTATRSIDGGAFGSGSLSAVTEIAFGIYSINFAASDLNGNVITLRVTSTNNDDVFVTFPTSF